MHQQKKQNSNLIPLGKKQLGLSAWFHYSKIKSLKKERGIPKPSLPRLPALPKLPSKPTWKRNAQQNVTPNNLFLSISFILI